MDKTSTPRMDAAREGKIKFHGKPCRKCGGTERYVCSSNCIACQKSISNVYHTKVRQARQEAQGAKQ